MTGRLGYASLCDAGEWRENGHFAYQKRSVRITETNSKMTMSGDVVKCFCDGTPLDCRVNYGYTRQLSFSNSMKTVEFNPNDMPRFDANEQLDVGGTFSATELKNLTRRFICGKLGKGKFTEDKN